jgi:TonB family protein
MKPRKRTTRSTSAQGRDCRRVRPLLGALHDGELDEVSQEVVRRHLNACADCRRDLAELEHLTALSRRADPPELADDYWDWLGTRVQRRLRQDQRPRQHFFRPSFFWPRLATLAAGLVVAVVVIAVGWQALGPGLFSTGPGRRSQMAQPRTSAAIEPETATAPGIARGVTPERVKQVGGLAHRAEQQLEATDEVRHQAEFRQEVARAAEPEPAPQADAGQARSGSDEPLSMNAQEFASAESHPALPAQSASRPKRQASVRGSGQVIRPELLSAPALPKVSVDDTGTVLVKITIDTLGRVLAAVVQRSSGMPVLDSLAVKAARESRFRPSRTRRTFEYPYRFESQPGGAHD